MVGLSLSEPQQWCLEQALAPLHAQYDPAEQISGRLALRWGGMRLEVPATARTRAELVRQSSSSRTDFGEFVGAMDQVGVSGLEPTGEG